MVEFQTVAGWVIGGLFYDEIKVATSISYGKVKSLLSKELPLKDDELDIIEAEIVACEEKHLDSKELFYEYIAQNQTIQEVLKSLEKREPQKSKEIVNAFKNNKKTKFNLDLESVDVVKSSFNGNDDCEMNIKL